MPLDRVRTRVAALGIGFAVAGCSLLAPATVLAGSSDASDTKSALSLYQQSTKAYNEGRFQDAIDLLTQAYALAKQPVILFNLARAYEGLGDLPKAIDAYKGYLESDPNTADRGSIEQRIETLQKQVDERVALERQRDEERRKAEEAALRAEEVRRSTQQQVRSGSSAIPWIIAGVGVAGLGTGVVLGVMTQSNLQTYRGDPPGPTRLTDYNRAKDDATYADIAYASGGVLAAVGVAWGLLDWRASRVTDGTSASGGTQVLVGVGSLALRQSF